ncbi:tRNA (adenosine(37)-N6)-threonylcarbamoyltransferase complex dimerization subunit type 1 TsaB [Candidatus Peregrinibacteria bacterium CG11_big_fil_rev_8_21_14_0_20_46_8]|nr:MAG: tRNA (adenosine(37)-N6)-threonylcarbamoyltransferase complex dimerization subunit type 1 TsaB [Candidatus Peregrinibacteria bacterium CG11_big_fil_rev_8_21_14_0_20_46_8]
MLTLGINTATETESVCLLQGEQLIDEIQWRGNRDEAITLLPNIEQLLLRNSFVFKDIRKIIVVCGPGPYGALRIGITVANTLALALQAELFEISAQEIETSLSAVIQQGHRKVKNVSPIYLRPPSITKAKK